MSAVEQLEEARLEGLGMDVHIDITYLPFARELAQYADWRGLKLRQAAVELIGRGLST